MFPIVLKRALRQSSNLQQVAARATCNSLSGQSCTRALGSSYARNFSSQASKLVCDGSPPSTVNAHELDATTLAFKSSNSLAFKSSTTDGPLKESIWPNADAYQSHEAVNIKPNFWLGQNAVPLETFTIDCTPYGPLSNDGPTPELKAKIEDIFRENGVVRLINTGLTELSAMTKYARVAIKEQMVYESGSNRREPIDGGGDNVFEVGAPGEGWLHYHHEMSYVAHSMDAISFCCKSAPADCGDTYLSDAVQVTDRLMETELGHKLKDLGVIYERCLTDREAYSGLNESKVYNHWQISMGVETPEEAESKARESGLECQWTTDPMLPGSDRFLRTIYRADAFEYCEELDRNILFTNIADSHMWFDSWPGVMEVPKHQRPLQMYFGDGSPISLEESQLLCDLYDSGGIRVQWSTGDVVAACNYRFAHGRPAYHMAENEKRELGVVLGQKFWRKNSMEGKW